VRACGLRLWRAGLAVAGGQEYDLQAEKGLCRTWLALCPDGPAPVPMERKEAYACRRCRVAIFTEVDVLRHTRGQGRAQARR
jgi:hypothetical protein